MPPPLWVQIIQQNRSRGVRPQGDLPLTLRQETNVTPIERIRAGTTSRRRGGRRTDREYPEGPEGVVARLRDQGLSEAQIKKLTEGEERDSFDVFSPSDWLETGGDVLGRALDIIDLPRAAVTSGLIEASDAIGAALNLIPGVDYQPPEETARLRQGGFSWRDFIENTKNRVGFADVLEATPEGAGLFGLDRGLPPLAKAGLGFAFDVASDPLNYLIVGAVDEPRRIARLFRSDEAIRALGQGDLAKGRQLADEAADRVLQRGVTSLKPDELAAIGRQGGLGLKLPGTGPIGRLTRFDRLMRRTSGGVLPRTVTIAPRGTRLGDLASNLAQGARKVSGLNLALRTVGKAAGAEGLAGNFPKLRAALRHVAREGEDVDVRPIDALLTIESEATGRSLGKAFEMQLTSRLTGLLNRARQVGVNGEDLWHALGGSNEALASIGKTLGDDKAATELVGEFSRFFEDARVVANERAGRPFVQRLDDYTPRFLTDEAREAFGRSARGGGRSLLRALTGRKMKVGQQLFGEELLDPAKAGRSIEEQIEDILARQGDDIVSWFKSDAYEAFPQYVRTLSRKLTDEWTGNELVRLGVGRKIPTKTKFSQGTQEAIPAGETALGQAAEGFRVGRRQAGVERNEIGRRLYELARDEGSVFTGNKKRRQLNDDLWRIWGELDEAVGQPVPWDDLYEKYRNTPDAVRTNIDLTFSRTVADGFRQYSTHAQLPENLADAMRVTAKVSEPGALSKVMALHDRLIRGWKKLALLTPGYHARNSFGGAWMNWIADVDEGRYVQLERLIANDPDAAPFFGRRKYKIPRPTALLSERGIDAELREAYEAAKRLGVFTGGQSIKEIEVVADERWPSLIRESRRLGGAVENRLRGAMFIDEYIKTGGDEAAALNKVFKYHFDYEALGPREETIRRLGIPFYTFTRRAVPVVAETIIRNPSKVNRYFQLQRSVESLSDEESLVPDYFEKNFAIRLPWVTGGNRMYLMPDLPLLSLVESSDPNLALGQLSPFIKTPYEWGSGKQIWKGIPLDEDPVEVPWHLGWLKPALRATGHLRVDSEGRDVMSEKDMYLLSQFLPQIGQARRLLPSEERYQERQLTSILSFVFGIGARTNTPREQANELWRRYDPYRQATTENERLGYGRDAARALAFGTP